MDETRNVTCTVCPMGCCIRVGLHDGEPVTFEGHQCKRGPVYARDELLDPRRMLTTTVRVRGGSVRLVPARTSASVPRDKLSAIMGLVRTLFVDAPVKPGQVLSADLLGTGVDLVASGSAQACSSSARGTAPAAPAGLRKEDAP